MKKLVSTALAGIVLGTSVFASTVPASAQRSFGDRERYVERYCERNRGDRDCNDFRRNRHAWDDRRYKNWYRRHHRDNDDAAAAAIFGLAAGAIIAGAANSNNQRVVVVDDHVDRCAARYRSYDPRTDTFLGYDGLRHRCTL